jgi:hypothetical protein
MEISTQDRKQLEEMIKQGMDEGWLDQRPDQILFDIQDNLSEMYIVAGVVRADETIDWSAQVKQFLQEREQQLVEALCDPDTAGLKKSFKTFLGKDDLPGLLNSLVMALLPIVVLNPEIEVAKYFPLAAKLAFYVARVGLDKWCAGMSESV